MAVKADQVDIDEYGPFCEGSVAHNKSLKRFSLMIATFPDAVNH